MATPPERREELLTDDAVVWCACRAFQLTTTKGSLTDMFAVVHRATVCTADTRTIPEDTRERAELLRRALQLVSHDRQAEYGSPARGFERVAAVLNALFDWPVLPWHVPLIMDALKTSRIVANPEHADSWCDKAGYAALGWEYVAQTRDLDG